jgi:hypothetical protein
MKMKKIILIGLVTFISAIFFSSFALSQSASGVTAPQSQAVNITTEPLTMTGMRPDPAPQAERKGPPFQPVSITTEPLTMTGVRQ